MKMDDKRIVKSNTDWKQLQKKYAKPRKIWTNDLLDDMKIMRTSWMNNARNGEIWDKRVEKANTHKGM